MIQTIDTFENDKYQTWEAESVDAAREKLKMRLLRRMDKTGLLRVNFDPLLTRLLREVRYFLLYTGKQIELPEGHKERSRAQSLFSSSVQQLERAVPGVMDGNS